MTRDEWMSNKKYRAEGAGLMFLGCLSMFLFPPLGFGLIILGGLWSVVDWIRAWLTDTPEFAKVACPACGRPEQLTLDTATWVCKECGVRSRFDAATRAAMPLGQFSEPPSPAAPPGPPTP